MTCYNSELPIGPPGPQGPPGIQGPEGPAYTVPYKTYVALLTQSGTNSPVVTELLNTTDFTITFTRAQAGRYTSNVFTADISKTTITCSIGYFDTATYTNGITISPQINGAGGSNVFFRIDTLENGNALIDGLLNNSVLEIVIYP